MSNYERVELYKLNFIFRYYMYLLDLNAIHEIFVIKLFVYFSYFYVKATTEMWMLQEREKYFSF